MLFVYSRVGKNRDTRRESPAAAGAGRTADHLSFIFSQKVLAVRSANDIYRPVSVRLFFAHHLSSSICLEVVPSLIAFSIRSNDSIALLCDL